MVSPGIIGPIIGALISGIIGIIVVEYREYKRQTKKKISWYNRILLLTQNIESIKSANWDDSEALLAYHISSNTSNQIQKIKDSAPINIEEQEKKEIMICLSKLEKQCYVIQDQIDIETADRHSDAIETRYEELYRKSEKLTDLIEDYSDHTGNNSRF